MFAPCAIVRSNEFACLPVGREFGDKNEITRTHKTGRGVRMEKVLEKLAEQILSFDEASLVHLREKYRLRIEHFDGTKEWEKAVIVYCLINAVSLKNTLFNENILKREKEKKEGTYKKRSGLKRVK
jgi:hypothetical protein